MAGQKTNRDRLRLWQERLANNAAAFSANEIRMDAREALYRGEREIKPLTDLDVQTDGTYNEAAHVRNIIAENIESEINSVIPQPKVTARRKKDEPLAALIENLIRNELDRMPFETINDQMERTVPIQGGGLFLVEWDNTLRTHTTVGEVVVSAIHPKQVVPQDGVYTGIEDMDYIILKLPQTKEYIKRKYNVDVFDEEESEPDVKSSEGTGTGDDMVTQYVGYFRNGKGGIGLYSWVNDTQLEYLEDYQARRLPRCTKCGAVRPFEVEPMEDPTTDGTYPGSITAHEAEQTMVWLPTKQQPGAAALFAQGDAHPQQVKASHTRKKEACPYCGNGCFEADTEDFEELFVPHIRADGSVIPGAAQALDEDGLPYIKPTRIPFYKPNVYPIVLQKNVSLYGQFLGDSDVDKITDQQNTINRLSKKIIDRLIKAGTRITLPDRADFRVDPNDCEKWYIGNAADKQLIDVFEFKGDLQYELLYLNQVYEEARQELGITDSFQGRHDSSAQSGVAKEFAAAQTAGRLESKRVMKNAAYAALFELIFKFWLAYADEPRSVVSRDEKGNSKYDIFDRYEFLEQDAAGEWYWNDRFLFSCDGSAPLANNRSAMWQESTMHLQAGAYGDPTQIDTLILYWTKMDLLHYPGAGETKSYLEKKLEERRVAMTRQMQVAGGAGTPGIGLSAPAGSQRIPPSAAAGSSSLV